MSSIGRRIQLRRADTCAVCTRTLSAGEVAIWDSARREARCIGCDPAQSSPASATAEVSEAGGSAQREYEGRRAQREARVRERFGALAGVVLAVSAEPQHERAWARGAEGEAKLARKLERWAVDRGVILLHDRRMPSRLGNIDHLAIGPSGVTVIDAKRYRGGISVERRGGLLRARTEHLMVGGRDRTKLVDGVLVQADAIRRILSSSHHGVAPVRAVLCFVDGDWPLLGRVEIRGVPVLPPRHAAKLCAAGGPLNHAMIRQISEELAAHLPAA